MEQVIKFLGLLCLGLLLVDFLLGNLWAAKSKQFFKKLSELMLNGAVMDVYHHQLGAILNFADKRIGRFIPGMRVLCATIFLLVLIQLLGTWVQVIDEKIPVDPSVPRNLIVFTFASTLSMSLCYTITYMVLYLVRNGGGLCWLLKYLSLVFLEILVSYILAPFGYASMFIFGVCPGCEWPSEMSQIESGIRTFAMVLIVWPDVVIRAGYTYIYNFQSLVNVALLFLTMMLCVMPTVLHVGLLITDIFRFIFKNICEYLMEFFDSCANASNPVRRLVLSALSFLSLIV